MKKYFWSLCVVALAATACSKDDTQDVPPPASVEGATIDQLGGVLCETKTSLDGTKVVWEEGDQITVWSSHVLDKKIFNLSKESIGQQAGVFTTVPGEGVKVKGDGAMFYAVYPTNSEGNIEIPSNQQWKGFANFFKDVNPMVAVGSDMSKMQFENPCGIIAIELHADDLQTRLISLELSSLTSILSGTARVDFSGTEYALNFTNTSQTVRLQCGEELTTDKNDPNMFYIVVPAGRYEDLTIKATYRRTGDEAGPRIFTRTRKKTAMDVQPGMITKVSANFELITHDPHVYKVGEPYPIDYSDANPVQGIVFQTAEDGLSGKIVALEDCTDGGTSVPDGNFAPFVSYTWGPAALSAIANVSSSTDGSANMEAVLAVDPSLESYPAFKACRDLGKEWYLPASDEMTVLMNAYYSLNFTKYGGSSIDGDGYWCSNTSGKAKFIHYFDQVEAGDLVKISPAKQGNVAGAVRAIAKFSSK